MTTPFSAGPDSLETTAPYKFIIYLLTLKAIYSSTYDTTMIILQYRIDHKINCMLHASV